METNSLCICPNLYDRLNEYKIHINPAKLIKFGATVAGINFTM